MAPLICTGSSTSRVSNPPLPMYYELHDNFKSEWCLFSIPLLRVPRARDPCSDVRLCMVIGECVIYMQCCCILFRSWRTWAWACLQMREHLMLVDVLTPGRNKVASVSARSSGGHLGCPCKPSRSNTIMGGRCEGQHAKWCPHKV